MRRPRVKVSATENESVYHCGSKSINGEWLFDDVAKEIFRRQIWQIADYCGVQVVTYTLLSNHFHVLIRIPQQQAVSDQELLRRYSVLYPRPSRFQLARLAVIQSVLNSNGPEAIKWRRRQLLLMGDVSQFMKLLKQRFSIWYNKTHRRFGPLWSDRFNSVLVEPRENVVRAIAAYIDLNCVRAGLVTDPMRYRFCGYAEAVSGNRCAQEGVCFVTGASRWREAQAHYREIIFGTGVVPREGAASIPPADFEQVMAEGGSIPLSTVLRCRIRYFNDGLVLGSRAFVELHLSRYRGTPDATPISRSRPVAMPPDLGELVAMRPLRRRSL